MFLPRNPSDSEREPAF
jgi:hypothetical protein